MNRVLTHGYPVSLDGRWQGPRRVPGADALRQAHARTSSTIPKRCEVFPGVEIQGGVCYFLWDREHNGPCEVRPFRDGQSRQPTVARTSSAYDVFVRVNEAVSILRKGAGAKNEPDGRTLARPRQSRSALAHELRRLQREGKRSRDDVLSKSIRTAAKVGYVDRSEDSQERSA